jgi:hypothetical protein
MHYPDDDVFAVQDFLNNSPLEQLDRQLSEYPLAQSLVKLLYDSRRFEFQLNMASMDRAIDLVSGLFAALWQAFGIVVGEVRRQDEFVLREGAQRRPTREILLGREISDDRIAEAVRNAQDLVRDLRGTPAVVVSQLCFAVETCIKRVFRRELAYPNSTVLGVIEKCRNSNDDRIKVRQHCIYTSRFTAMTLRTKATSSKYLGPRRLFL